MGIIRSYPNKDLLWSSNFLKKAFSKLQWREMFIIFYVEFKWTETLCRFPPYKSQLWSVKKRTYLKFNVVPCQIHILFCSICCVTYRVCCLSGIYENLANVSVEVVNQNRSCLKLFTCTTCILYEIIIWNNHFWFVQGMKYEGIALTLWYISKFRHVVKCICLTLHFHFISVILFLNAYIWHQAAT